MWTAFLTVPTTTFEVVDAASSTTVTAVEHPWIKKVSKIKIINFFKIMFN